LSQNEIDAAKLAQWNTGVPGDLNVQEQPHYTWPAVYVVARAYLDQLNRDHALAGDRVTALNDAMTQVDGMAAGADRSAAVAKLDAMAEQLRQDAARVVPERARAAGRMRACANVILEHDRSLR
ncbi:MAG: hypothetical protein ACRD2D_11255, partial [Terriglobales bacterium]